jgi:hypothetical protein
MQMQFVGHLRPMRISVVDEVRLWEGCLFATVAPRISRESTRVSTRRHIAMPEYGCTDGRSYGQTTRTIDEDRELRGRRR